MIAIGGLSDARRLNLPELNFGDLPLAARRQDKMGARSSSPFQENTDTPVKYRRLVSVMQACKVEPVFPFPLDRISDFKKRMSAQGREVPPTASARVITCEVLISDYPAPRYTHRDWQVSATTISVRSGSAGLRRVQIHSATFSLVGFSSPGISFK